MTFRIYKITSVNTPFFYVGLTNYNKYLSLVLHNFIKQYKKYILENTKYNICYYVIHHNDISIELLHETDSLYEAELFINGIEVNDENYVNNKNFEIEDKVN